MKRIHKIVAFVLALVVLISAAMISTAAADSNKAQTGASGITIHYYCEGGTPNIYYWNSLPDNIETSYPGPAMQSEGNNWYKYTFSNKTKINILFVKNGVQSDELTRESGEWWYKNNRWHSKDPAQGGDWDRSDMREDSIYFVITTRFYDGDKSNNVHCWDDGKAGNPDSDPGWRGDFKGLIQKLDYIKALGFTTVWITPVVENTSWYDYHGYHASNFSKVDPRYESSDCTYQDLIDAAHEKGMKIVQDVVWNHTGNFGENYLCHLFDKKYTKIQDLATPDCLEIDKNSNLYKTVPNYDTKKDGSYQQRLSVIKSDKYETNNYYHHDGSFSYESASEQTGQMHDDCVDINTENQKVADYLNSSYKQYADMGVDGFRLDTEKHISRWTLNHAYFPAYKSYKDFFIFGEVCARVRGVWNHDVQSSSCPFYTWKETESAWTNNWSTTDWQSNYNNSVKHYNDHANAQSALTSQNAFLNGVNYHTPDYSKANGTGTIDFTMHWNFENANSAFSAALGEDQYFNDSTWNVTYVDSHDYGPDGQQDYRYRGGEQAWAENMNLMFTFRGIPCIFYGSEIQFKNDVPIDVGPNKPLADTGRAYFGDNIEGSINVTDFGKYNSASGSISNTLNKPLAKHLNQLNQIRRAVPALQKGQYTTSNVNGGNIAYTRRYTANGVDSLACVAISGGATFSNLPNGTYVDAVTGSKKTVSNGTLTSDSIGKGNMRVWVLENSSSKVHGKIGDNGTYLK